MCSVVIGDYIIRMCQLSSLIFSFVANMFYCGWLNFRGLPIFMVFVEGQIHIFKYPRISDFMQKL